MNNPIKQERICVFKDSARFKNKKRIIKFSNVQPWTVYDCGYSLSKAAYNYDIRLDIFRQFQNRYNFDLADVWTRNPIRIADELGSSLYTLDDKNYGVNWETDIMLFDTNEYEVLIRDYKEFLWTCIMPRKFYKLTDENAIENLKNAMLEYKIYLKFMDEASEMSNNEFGLLSPLGTKGFYPMFDNLFKNWRGIKALSIDLRKNPEYLDEVVKKYFIMGINTDKLNVETVHGSDPSEGADLFVSMLSHTILSNVQFERFFYPCLKFIFEYAEKYDKIVRFMIQGESERLWDYFMEAPKGHIIFQLEMDDIFKAKKTIGKIGCLAGGMTTDILGYGTVNQNINLAKKLVDEVGYDGAFMIGSNKMLCSPNDCKRENLLAVHEYIDSVSLS